MEKKVVSQFYQHEHPLILIENVNDEESPNYCNGCLKPVANTEMVYTCVQQGCRNRYFRHKKCEELPNQISHPQHSHPLHLFYFNKFKDDGGNYVGDDLGDDCGFDLCDLCKIPIQKEFGYRCPDCNFKVDVKCAEVSIEERKELQHPSHPHHRLMLFRKPRFSFHCDGCGDEDVDTAYICSTCEFWLHNSCASLPDKLHIGSHHHPLSLVFSLPEKHIKYRYRCDVCTKYCDASRWSYFCGDCRYIVHIKCAIRSSIAKSDDSNLNEDGGDVIEFPLHGNDIPHKLIKPFVMREKRLINTTSTNTSYLLEYYHEHPLRLVSEFTHEDDDEKDEEEDDEEEEELKICDVCITPISNSSYYECVTSTCTYSIHSICSLLPHTLQHSSSSSSSSNLNSLLLALGECKEIPNKIHNFTLSKSKGWDASLSYWQCGLCNLLTNGMVYECGDCRKKIDVKCASLPTTIRHASHTHRHKKPLTLTSIPPSDDARKRLCHGCNCTLDDHNKRLACFCKVDGCDFCLHLRCVVLPSSVTNREWDKHPLLLLTSDASRDHPSDFFCELCEREMHPKNWMYHCFHCDASSHLYCSDTGFGYYRNMKFGKKYEFEGIHPNHPLTFTCVTLKKHCDLCHRRYHVHTWFGFECATCYYVLCRGCGFAELTKKLS